MKNPAAFNQSFDDQCRDKNPKPEPILSDGPMMVAPSLSNLFYGQKDTYPKPSKKQYNDNVPDNWYS